MKGYRALLLVGVALAFCSGVYATTIHVPADQPTIQAGIDMALEGDTVLVAAGTYRGNIDLGKTLVIKGVDAIIDSSAFTTTSSAIIEGFTIINAINGIEANGGFLTVVDCNFTNNLNSGINHELSGGLSCKRSAFTGNPTAIMSPDRKVVIEVDSCVFENNYTAFSGQFVISNSVIRNGVNGVEGGGGCWVYYVVLEYHFTNCLFEGMTGVVVEATGGGTTLDKCVIRNNESIGSGYGLCMDCSHNLSFTNCTIYGNNGGITVDHCTNLSLQNCIYAQNGGGIIFSTVSCCDSRLTLSCNDFYGPAYPDTTGGNIIADPRFCDTSLYLQSESPCIDNSCGLIGALGIGCLEGDVDGDSTVNIADVVFLIDYIFMGGAAPQPLWLGDADCSGSINIADCVYLINYIFSHGPAPCGEF